jgi:hypothetical protein
MTAGCGDCHGGVSTAATVSLQGVTGSVTMTPGEKREFTIIVAHSSAKVAGVGVAVRTTATGSTAAGTLAVIPGMGMRLRGSELTQSAPRTMTNGQVMFSFTFTAPTTEGTYFMQAIGNACNGNGSEDSGDDWNWMSPVEIKVEIPTSVDDEVAYETALRLFPQPWNGTEQLMISGLETTDEKMQIVDMNGQTVQDVCLCEFNSSSAPQPLRAITLPKGVYAILVNGAKPKRTMFIVQ